MKKERSALPLEALNPKDWFGLLSDSVPVSVAYYAADNLRCQFANRRYAETFDKDVHSILGSRLEEVIGVQDSHEVEPQLGHRLHQRSAVTYQCKLPSSVGSAAPRWIEAHILPHLSPPDPAEKVLGLFVMISDITKFLLAEKAARDSEERLAKFMQATAEGIVFHKDGFVTDANPALCELLGYTLNEVTGRRTLDFVAHDQVAKVSALMAAGLENTFESVVLSKSGQRIAVECIARSMLHQGEQIRMTVVRDIRDRHLTQTRINHLAHHDALTGLPNRTSFMEHLEHSMAAARLNSSPLALLFIDLDHFKRVNDSLGHLAGDTLLRTVASRITASLRTTDIVARFGGDEFMVLMSGMPGGERRTSEPNDVAKKLLASIGSPVNAEGRPICVTPSIGIALYPHDGATPEALVKNADSAMYGAKARGRANYRFYDPSMAASAYADLVLEGQLAQALDRGEFELFFQPQLSAQSGLLVGAEALLRWHHPDRGLLLAEEFIPVAEQRRLMLGIGQWVWTEAIRCALHWRAMGLRVAPVAVNLSDVQFQSTSFIEDVAQGLPAAGIEEGLFEFELTERMLMDNVPEVKQRLNRLKAMGLRISVDDFGTGYSSLVHLKDLPIDKIKVDRSFVHDLPDNRDSAAITCAIIQMGRSLGLTVVAEGVQTEAQRHFLAENGCHGLQGSWISPALSQSDFEDWLLQSKAGC